MTTLLLCALSLCSDDMLGVLGNERLQWNPSETATYYVIALHDWGEDGASVYAECASTNATSKDLAGTTCYGDRLVVKACKPDTEEPIEADLCSDYNVTEPVEVLPFACLRGSAACYFSDDGDSRNDRCEVCETPCFEGAPLRLPSVPGCGP